MKRVLLLAGVYASPLVVLAQRLDDAQSFVQQIVSIINEAIVPLILALAFLWFVYGVFRYFIASTDEAKEKGRDIMVFGLIGFFVIISVWGLVNIVTGSFDLNVDAPKTPKVEVGG